MEAIDDIIATMTDGQKRAILAVEKSTRDARILVLPVRRDRGAMNRSLVELGLAGFSSHGAALVRKGKDVRLRLIDLANGAMSGAQLT